MAKHLFIITGASRGIGQAIAYNLAKQTSKQETQHFVLLSRNLEALENTKTKILGVNQQADVKVSSVDLANLSSYSNAYASLFEKIKHSDYQRATLINNAGSLGRLGFVKDLPNNMEFLKEVDNEMRANISSVFALNSQFLSTFKGGNTKLGIVNLSSGAAWHPFKTMGLYCIHKSARVMMHQVIAAEEPDVRVLNYSPGVVETDMQAELRKKSIDGTPEKDMLVSIFEKKEAVPIDLAAQELIKILDEDTFTNGESIDFYTRQPELIPKTLLSPPPEQKDS